MGKGIVGFFSFSVLADTRDACLEKMDNTGREVLDLLGGVPWVQSDDDIKKVSATSTIRDDQGMCYVGTATYQFRGPALADVGIATHAGFDVQKGVDDG